MSVKGKVKRLNKQLNDLNYDLKITKRIMENNQIRYMEEKEMLESLIKFFVNNQVGDPAEGGVHIEKKYVDKLDSLGIDIWYELENNAYVIKYKEVNANEENEEFI